MAERAKKWLLDCPDCQIISITQNDWAGACECPDCKALDEAEGSHSGTMLSFANYLAEKIEPEFPNVAVDTFAYQYTRKPPKTIRPRPNVIVRLCSIECCFAHPLEICPSSENHRFRDAGMRSLQLRQIGCNKIATIAPEILEIARAKVVNRA